MVKQLDPYWSLWGKLKGRSNMEGEIAGLYEEGLDKLADLAADEIPELLLPLRKIAVPYDGSALYFAAAHKSVNSDRHAVNTLRKVDTDDAYFAQVQEVRPC